MVGRWGGNEVIPSPAPPPLLLLAGLVSLCPPVTSRGGLYQASQTSVRPADGRGPPHWPRRGRWHVQGFMSRRSACRSEPGSAREGQSLHIHCRTGCSDQEVMFLPPCRSVWAGMPRAPCAGHRGTASGPCQSGAGQPGEHAPSDHAVDERGPHLVHNLGGVARPQLQHRLDHGELCCCCVQAAEGAPVVAHQAWKGRGARRVRKCVQGCSTPPHPMPCLRVPRCVSTDDAHASSAGPDPRMHEAPPCAFPPSFPGLLPPP